MWWMWILGESEQNDGAMMHVSVDARKDEGGGGKTMRNGGWETQQIDASLPFSFTAI